MKKLIYPAALALVILFLVSCATVKAVPPDSAVENLLVLINSGDSKTMTEITNIPMLIDGEIIQRKTDAEHFWDLMNKASFSFGSSSEFRTEPADSNTYMLFGDTMEVRTFFDKYIPDTALLVKVKGSGGDYAFLLSGRKGKYPYIFGFTGPLK